MTHDVGLASKQEIELTIVCKIYVLMAFVILEVVMHLLTILLFFLYNFFCLSLYLAMATPSADTVLLYFNFIIS